MIGSDAIVGQYLACRRSDEQRAIVRQARRNGGSVSEMQLQMFWRDRIADRDPIVDCVDGNYSAVRERRSGDVGPWQVAQLLADFQFDLRR